MLLVNMHYTISLSLSLSLSALASLQVRCCCFRFPQSPSRTLGGRLMASLAKNLRCHKAWQGDTAIQTQADNAARLVRRGART